MNHRVALTLTWLALGLILIVSNVQADFARCWPDDMYAAGYVVDEKGDRLRDRLVVVFFDDEELGRDYSGEQGEFTIRYEYFASSPLCRLVVRWNLGAIKEGKFRIEMVERHKRAYKVYQGVSSALPKEIIVNKLRITADGEIVPAIENGFEPSPSAPPAPQPDGLSRGEIIGIIIGIGSIVATVLFGVKPIRTRIIKRK